MLFNSFSINHYHKSAKEFEITFYQPLKYDHDIIVLIFIRTAPPPEDDSGSYKLQMKDKGLLSFLWMAGGQLYVVLEKTKVWKLNKRDSSLDNASKAIFA